MKNSCSGIKEDWCCKGKSPWKQHALKGQKLLAQGVWGKQGESSGKICGICAKSSA